MKKILVLAMILPLVMSFVLQPTTAAGGTSITTYVVPAITDVRILPTTAMSSDYVSNQVSIVACRGEYEPATFVVQANEAITSLAVEATDLAGPSGSILSTDVDIRVVKCWYVAGTTMPYRGTKTLVPELLLKDDTLVKVENGENYVKLTTGEYVWISDPTATSTQYPTIESMPIKDSPTLLPVDIPAGTNKQFWVTVHVPESTAAGTYVGNINLSTTASGLMAQMSLELQVLPFDLLPSMMTYSTHYGCVLKSQGTISSYAKNAEQYKAELENIAAHSGDAVLTQPVYFSETSSTQAFKNALSLRNQAGVDSNDLLYGTTIEYLGWDPDNPTDTAALTQKVQSIIDTARQYGVTQVYITGMDEKQGEELANQRPAWEAVISTGAKMWVCGHRAGAGATAGEDNFSLVSDLLDVFVCARAPDAAEAARWHSVGHKIWCYAYPMSGGEVPNTYRRNYGLLLWQKDYDGGMAIYQWKAGFIWNDFDDPYNWKGHTFAYPTVNGVIDTTEWEGWREARDDTRYLATLIDAIEQAKTDGRDTSAAETWLANLKSCDLTTKNLGTIRSEMVTHILSLNVVDTTIQPGDANADGTLNTADLTLIERIIAGMDGSTPGADANSDGSINTADITKLEQMIGS